MLERGIVGKEIARDLSQAASSQETSDVMRPQILEDGPQLLIRGPALEAGLVDLIAVVVVGKLPAMKQGTGDPIVPERYLFTRRHNGVRGAIGVGGTRCSRGVLVLYVYGECR